MGSPGGLYRKGLEERCTVITCSLGSVILTNVSTITDSDLIYVQYNIVPATSNGLKDEVEKIHGSIL